MLIITIVLMTIKISKLTARAGVATLAKIRPTNAVKRVKMMGMNPYLIKIKIHS